MVGSCQKSTNVGSSLVKGAMNRFEVNSYCVGLLPRKTQFNSFVDFSSDQSNLLYQTAILLVFSGQLTIPSPKGKRITQV